MRLSVKPELSKLRSALFPLLSIAYLVAIFGGPLSLSLLLWRAPVIPRCLTLLSLPLLYTIGFSTIAGCLSLSHQKAILPGKFPRNVGHAVYFHRRLYGLCWTSLFYFKPLYFLVLSIEPLRKYTFRLFGYRGNLDFSIYPDTWIRDLPLLSFGVGAYLSNKATIGTNIVLPNGRILVGPIVVEEGAVVGHAAMLAPGCHIGKRAEVGVGTGLGLNVRVEEQAKIGPLCGIDNCASIGFGSKIGGTTMLGPYVRIGDGISIPRASAIPERTQVNSESEAVAYVPTSPKFIPDFEPSSIGALRIK